MSAEVRINTWGVYYVSIADSNSFPILKAVNVQDSVGS